MSVNGLVPARFLTLVSHFIITVVIFLSKDENIQACLPLDYTPEEFDYNSKILLVGLILTLIFLGLEFICFLSGISMFMPIQGIISTVAHATAALTLSFFVIDEWKCTDFFYIFGFCSAFPALTEFIVVIATFAHAGASISLSYFIVDTWECQNYFYVFAMCSAFPAFTELVVVAGAMVFRV